MARTSWIWRLLDHPRGPATNRPGYNRNISLDRVEFLPPWENWCGHQVNKKTSTHPKVLMVGVTNHVNILFQNKCNQGQVSPLLGQSIQSTHFWRLIKKQLGLQSTTSSLHHQWSPHLKTHHHPGADSWGTSPPPWSRLLPPHQTPHH